MKLVGFQTKAAVHAQLVKLEFANPIAKEILVQLITQAISFELKKKGLGQVHVSMEPSTGPVAPWTREQFILQSA